MSVGGDMKNEAKLVKTLYLKGGVFQIVMALFFFLQSFLIDTTQSIIFVVPLFLVFIYLKFLRNDPLKQRPYEERKAIIQKYSLPPYTTFIFVSMCIALLLTSFYVWNWSWSQSLYFSFGSLLAILGSCTLLYALRMKTA